MTWARIQSGALNPLNHPGAPGAPRFKWSWEATRGRCHVPTTGHQLQPWRKRGALHFWKEEANTLLLQHLGDFLLNQQQPSQRENTTTPNSPFLQSSPSQPLPFLYKVAFLSFVPGVPVVYRSLLIPNCNSLLFLNKSILMVK